MLATSNVGHLPFSPLILYRLKIRIQIILVDSICQRVFDGEKNAPVLLPLFESSHIARSIFCFPEAYFLIAPPPPALSCQREVFSCHFTIILLPLPTPPGRLHLASVCFQLPLSVAQLSQPGQAGDGEGEVGSWGWCVCVGGCPNGGGQGGLGMWEYVTLSMPVPAHSPSVLQACRAPAPCKTCFRSLGRKD